MTTSTSVSCGWPAKHWPGEKGICPCGFIFPERYHPAPIKAAELDDWLNDGDDAENLDEWG